LANNDEILVAVTSASPKKQRFIQVSADKPLRVVRCFTGSQHPLSQQAGAEVELYICIREVLGSNLGWDSDYIA
jgi:hypothetical protein